MPGSNMTVGEIASSGTSLLMAMFGCHPGTGPEQIKVFGSS
jgi:hypothetical protein